jgi:outer membrane protein assembly factor BamA
VLFDNIPWFTDAELSDAIRKSVPVFDGTAPQESPLLDDMAAALGPLLAARGLKVTVEHQLLANPSGDGSLQVFRVEGAALKIGRVEFGDPLAAQSPYLQQKLEAVVGKPYSRLAIDLFLFEHVRPFYQEQGCLRASIGTPEIRLTGNPNQAFAGDMGVFIPIQPGSVYHWGGAQWIGNQALAVSELNALIGAQASDVVNGQRIQAGWDKVLDEYAHRGYLDAKVDPQSAYDDAKHTVAYQVHVSEGPQYRYGDMLVTGLSVLGEKKIRSAWNVPAGAIFDRAKFEELLAGLEKKSTAIFGDLPVHYEQVGHWLRTNPDTRTVDILLDFK